jgi:hypothetical protein
MKTPPTCLLYIYVCPSCGKILVRDMADCQAGVAPLCEHNPECGEFKHVGSIDGRDLLQRMIDDGSLDVEVLDERTDGGDRILMLTRIGVRR